MLEPTAINVLEEVAVAGPSTALSPIARRQWHSALELARFERLGLGWITGRLLHLDGVNSGVLSVGGERLSAPRLIPETGRLTGIACGVGTLGDSLNKRVGELFQEGHRSLALALDTLGNEFLFALSRKLEDRLMMSAQRLGLAMAGELRAGDPGLALDHQAAIVRLAGGERVGVTVTNSSMLFPAKSLSVLFGIGIDLPEVTWSRCDNCPSRSKCGHRKRGLKDPRPRGAGNDAPQAHTI